MGDDRVSYKEQILSEQIVLKKIDTPDSFGLEAAHFINLCIRRRPQSRLGINGVIELKSHIWFKDYDWNSLSNRTMRSPFKPSTSGYKINKRLLSEKQVQ